MSVAITGASGALGRRTAELLLGAVDPSDVVLVTHTPEALDDLRRRGADVRPGDFDAPQALAAAFAGVERLLLISTATVGDRLEGQLAAVAAARRAGVRHVAYTSVPEPDGGNPALVAPDHAATERALRDSGLRWTALRNNLYAHMQAPVVAQAIASGRLVTNAGDGRVAYVSREDCAAAAAAVLTQPGHEDRAYDVTGAEALSAADLAALAAELGGGPVAVVHVDDAALAQGLRGAGLPAQVADVVVSIGAATRGGYFATVAPTVGHLTGRRPSALRDVIAEAPAAPSV